MSQSITPQPIDKLKSNPPEAGGFAPEITSKPIFFLTAGINWW